MVTSGKKKTVESKWNDALEEGIKNLPIDGRMQVARKTMNEVFTKLKFNSGDVCVFLDCYKFEMLNKMVFAKNEK